MRLSWVTCGYALPLGLCWLGCWVATYSIKGLRALRATQWAVALAMCSCLMRALRFQSAPIVRVLGK